ncbi:hypothetical protein EUGRSUZ_E00423 [Eucalyptus grandis]|uniref:Uncharacterized protein n=2 Tax=Eucalyptus grandis TaxID=71139 RepID=A0ACC3KRD9_EUCGR|nr:hypothetical protein EUGRSUZ_E00423 [Eucalyptus grandis]
MKLKMAEQMYHKQSRTVDQLNYVEWGTTVPIKITVNFQRFRQRTNPDGQDPRSRSSRTLTYVFNFSFVVHKINLQVQRKIMGQ